MTLEQEADKNISKIRSVVGRWLAVSCTIFVMYTMATLSLQALQILAIFLAFSLALAFIHYPLNPDKPDLILFVIIDLILAALAFSFAVYIYFDYWDFIFRVGAATDWDMFFGIVTILLVFEATRRVVGWPLLIIALCFLAYGFLGQYLPSPLSHTGYDLERIATTLFMSKNGMFGVPLNVMVNFIYLFIAFGAFFETCGGTEFFVDLASALFGRQRGGPAKVAVAVSGMMGTISGSAVANTVTTGALTIPLMKRIGFEPHVAGAVEAVASTGGQLMPPVMGAAAFIMAEYLGVSYLEVCKAALIPSILYFLAIYSVVHFYSLKIGIQGLPASELPSIKLVFRDKWMFVIPLAVLIVILIFDYSPRIAVLYALIAIVVMSFFRKKSRMTPAKILSAMANTGYNCVMVACACATAGIVIGMILLTGLSGKITALVIALSSGSLIIALPIVMFASLLFGMGLPTVVCYVLLATTAAPSLVHLGVSPMAAHLYIFYFGMLCMVTPPVALAAYAGAAIAGASPMKTGWTAWRFALAGFLLPYMFVYNSSLLLTGSAVDISFAVLTSIIGVICLGGGIIGYFLENTSAFERLLLFAAALLLIKPGIITDIAGFLCVLLIILLQLKARKKVAN